MNRRGQVLVKGGRSTVADDDVAIGEWAKIGSVISVDFLKGPVAEADVRFGAQSGLKSDIARGPKRASSRHSPAPQERMLIPIRRNVTSVPTRWRRCCGN